MTVQTISIGPLQPGFTQLRWN